MGEVGEDTHGEVKAGDTVLLHADGAHFHEAVLATLFHHAGEQAVEGDGVHGGVLGLQALVSYIVGDRGQQAALVTQAAEQVVQQRDGGRLAVGAGDTHQRQLPGRMAVELICRQRHGLAAVLHHLELHRRDGRSFGDMFANDSRRAFVDGGLDIVVAVARIALDGYEQGARNHFPGIGRNQCEVSIIHLV